MRERVKDLIWGMLSLMFIILVCFLYFSNLFYLHPFITNSNIILYNSTEHHSCHVTITEPVIILRLDDVRAYSEPTPFIVDEVIKRNMSMVLGVIPRDLEKDKIMIDYLNKIENNPNIEIAQHGYYHNESDINISLSQVLAGNEVIQKYIGVKPFTYIPPYNLISENSINNISGVFSVITDKNGKILKEGKTTRIGWNSETFNYNKNYTVLIQTILDECKKSLYDINLCVVVMHPQEYQTEEKKKEYIDLLNNLSSMNIKFKTFKDIVFCEDEK